MAQPITNTPAVNYAIKTAQDLPDLVSKLHDINPAIADQITGKALLASKSAWATWLVPVIAYVAAKYGFGWDEDTDKLVAGALLIVISFLMRTITTAPITSWIFKRREPPVSTGPSQAVKVAAIFMLLGMGNLTIVGCATISAEAAKVQQLVAQNAAKIQKFCDAKVLPAINNPLTGLALTGASALPYGGDFVLAVNSAKATCEQVDKVATSATTKPWLTNEVSIIEGKGNTPPPAPIAPAPITADTVLATKQD